MIVAMMASAGATARAAHPESPRALALRHCAPATPPLPLRRHIAVCEVLRAEVA